MKTIKIVAKNMTAYVLESFAKDYPDYKKHIADPIDFFKKTNITQYLHSLTGPALIDTENGMKNYFINGEWFSKEDWLKKCIDYKTNGKITEVIIQGENALEYED